MIFLDHSPSNISGLHLRAALLQRRHAFNGFNEASGRRHHLLVDRRRHVFHAVHHAVSVDSALSRVFDLRPYNGRRRDLRRFRAWIGHRRRHRLLDGIPRAISIVLLSWHDRQPDWHHRGGGIRRQYPGNVRRGLSHADHVPGPVNLSRRTLDVKSFDRFDRVAFANLADKTKVSFENTKHSRDKYMYNIKIKNSTNS